MLEIQKSISCRSVFPETEMLFIKKFVLTLGNKDIKNHPFENPLYNACNRNRPQIFHVLGKLHVGKAKLLGRFNNSEIC